MHLWIPSVGLMQLKWGGTLYNLRVIYYIIYIKSISFAENSVDPDKMEHNVTFQLGLHSLPKNAFRNH